MYLVSGVTAAGDPVTQAEELHVSILEEVTEWTVVRNETEMKMSLTWSTMVCGVDSCTSDDTSEVMTGPELDMSGISSITSNDVKLSDISDIERSMKIYDNLFSGVVVTSTSPLINSESVSIELHQEEFTEEELDQVGDHEVITSERNVYTETGSTHQPVDFELEPQLVTSPSPALIFSVGSDAAGQDSLIFSVKPRHEYVTTPSSSVISFTLIPTHGSTDGKTE